MENLGQIKIVERNISSASTKAIRALHKLVFGYEGDRKNRQRLREFGGFTFNDKSAEYQEKLLFVQEHFGERDLIAICNVLCLDYSGRIDELASKICDALLNLQNLQLANNDIDDDDNEADDDAGESDAEAPEQGSVKSDTEEHQNGAWNPPRNRNNTQHFSFRYEDIESTIRPFDGSDVVESWIDDFEDAAKLFGWSPLQKVIFAKRTLKGLAKLLVQSERGLTT